MWSPWVYVTKLRYLFCEAGKSRTRKALGATYYPFALGTNAENVVQDKVQVYIMMCRLGVVIIYRATKGLGVNHL